MSENDKIGKMAPRQKNLHFYIFDGFDFLDFLAAQKIAKITFSKKYNF